MDKGNGWATTTDETVNKPFWICWHACMLFLHGAISYNEFKIIYDKHAKL